MPTSTPPAVMGIVAALRGGVPEVAMEIRLAAQRRGIELRPVDAANIGQLVGSALGEFPVWLILYSEADDKDLLMLPYPAQFGEAEWDDASRRAADNLFEWIRADRNSKWTAGKGHENLVAAESRGRLPEALRCFQAIRLPAPLREYIRGAIPRGTNSVSESFAERIGGWFRAAADKIEDKRRALKESLERGDSVETDLVRDSFDATLMDEAARIADHARVDSIVREPPRLAFLRTELGASGLDPESERFLETALLVEEMAIQLPGSRIDFSAAACPLWKMVELETNLSVGWLVRLIRQVASNESGRIARLDRDPRDRVEVLTGREPHQRVELNERVPDDVQRLKGLMLGPMQYLLGFGGENGVRDEVIGVVFDGEWARDSLDKFLFDTRKRSNRALPYALRRISDLRNRHAHDTAMNRDKYDTLKGLALGPSDESPSASLIGRLVSLKHAVRTFAGA
jgi:hypothetical protein